MKKILLKFTFVILACAGGFIACQDSIIDMVTDDSMTVEEAQVWFESRQPEFLVWKSANVNKKPKVIKPDWKTGFTSKKDNVEIVEVNLLSQGTFGYATKENYDEWVKTGKNDYLTSMPRLVVMKDKKKTGETISFIMTILGDKDYLEKNQFNLWHNSYLQKDKDFSGMVLFHSTEGKFVNGWRFTKGKVTHTIKRFNDMPLSVNLKSGYYVCITFNVYGWVQYCTDYYTIGQTENWSITTYTGTSCEGPVIEYIGAFQECEWFDDDGNSGYDPGGYSPPVETPTFNSLPSFSTLSSPFNVFYNGTLT